MTASTVSSLAFVALSCAVAAAQAQAPAPARLVAAQSEIRFQIKQSGVPVEGRFARFDVQLALDPKAPQTGNVTVTIETGSATYRALRALPRDAGSPDGAPPFAVRNDLIGALEAQPFSPFDELDSHLLG